VDTTTGLWYDPEDSGNGNYGSDWHDQLQLMIRHGYTSGLGAQPENHPFLLVERSYNPPPIRQQTLECLFEELQMPAVFFAKDATLACYACGRTTGTVVDIGYGGTTVTPVYEGYVEQKGIRRSPIGTMEMDERILKTLDHVTKKPIMPLYQVRRPSHSKREGSFHRLARLQVAQQCREDGVGAAVDTTATAVAFAARNAPFKLPDGQTVLIPSAHRFAVANLLLDTDEESSKLREELCEAQKTKLSSFITATSNLKDDENAGDGESDKSSQYTEATALGISSPSTRRGRAARRTAVAAAKAAEPKKITHKTFPNRVLQKACVPYLQMHLDNLTSAPLAAMVCDAAFRCDRDQHPQLLGNVVLAGGGACLGPTEQAVPDFLRTGVESIIHQHTPGWRVKVLSPGIQERKICSWLGGSILGSLGTFHEMWITRAEYDEFGTAIVNRKCP
jgi:actin-related protein